MTSRILICDDEPYLALALALKFKGAGFDVVTARDGVEAWESLQERPADLLITDCTMPRMDGLELCRRIRSNHELRELPIFMLSARNFELNGSAVVAELGIDRCMGKPFSPGELLRQVVQVLRGEHHRVVVE
jgi:DNA-binding response OmpR family regulator